MSQPQHDNPTETMTMVVVAAIAVGAVMGSAGLFWDQIVAWLIDGGMLAPSSADILWALPAAEGAGLDATRLRTVGAVGLGLLLVGVAFARRTNQKKVGPAR